MKLLTSLSPRALKLLIIGLPTLLVGIYLWLFAADRYVSEATLAVRRLGAEPASAVPGIATLLTGTNPQSREDIFYVQYYIHSLALLRKLDAEMNVREHYASPRLDPFYRLWPWTGQERFLGVFRDRVQVIFDDAASLLTIRVQGFDPAFAQRLNRRIVEESERFVNELSQRMAREQLAFAEDELKKAAERVQDAKNQVLAFQNRNRLLDPTFQAQASGALLAELQATRARLESDLNSLLTYRNEDSPQVRELRSRIAAVRKQADAEAANATASGRKGEQLTALAVDFQALQMQAEFAVDAYKLSLAAVESARIDATRKIKTAVIIEPPSLPETPELPRRLYALVTVFVASLLVYAIVRLVLATVREHQD
jgi:capsular polysaccharide transport system permease protein